MQLPGTITLTVLKEGTGLFLAKINQYLMFFDFCFLLFNIFLTKTNLLYIIDRVLNIAEKLH